MKNKGIRYLSVFLCILLSFISGVIYMEYYHRGDLIKAIIESLFGLIYSILLVFVSIDKTS